MKKIRMLIAQNKQFLVFIGLMCVFRSAVADWNTVPSGSMLPTIQIGDRIGINKLAYDVKIPFVNISIARLSQPQRGDIVVFESAAAGKRMVKRVIGLPGDSITMINNALSINGRPLNYNPSFDDQTTTYISESFSNNSPPNGHTIGLTKDQASDFDYFGPVTVPEDMFLVLGDNRRNSADSRIYGFIPRNEIIGKAQNVVVSFNPNNYYLPRKDRVWQPLI
ncbi:MAG: signal peptidase I [Gammaproteobacteria bacterium]|nr:signal peptidase I [Gammaproteobacteria bacterium]